METALNKPYLTSWFIIPILILIGLVFNQHTIDIQLHDTYFVIGNLQVVLAASLLLLVVGLGYWFINRLGKSPNRVLTAMHLLLTVGVVTLFASPIAENSLGLSALFTWSVITLLLAQILYLANIFICLLWK
jgi:heme/copper-type cytochrome/quinol oxidase subunit 1